LGLTLGSDSLQIMQLELHLNKCRDATPEEVREWREKDYFSKGDFDVMKLFVLVPSLIQVFMIGLMLGIFLLNDNLF
jgi:hypothetical protein